MPGNRQIVQLGKLGWLGGGRERKLSGPSWWMTGTLGWAGGGEGMEAGGGATYWNCSENRYKAMGPTPPGNIFRNNILAFRRGISHPTPKIGGRRMHDDRTMADLMDGLEFMLDDLDRICRDAFAKYRSYDPSALVEHDARAAAACTYCHMAADAERRWPAPTLATPPEESIGLDVIPIDVRGLKVWAVREVAVLRFKKHDEDGFSRNYPTKQAKDYDRGLPFPELPAPAARLSVGYLLDPTGTVFVRPQ